MSILRNATTLMLALVLGLTLAGGTMTGCEDLPGDRGTQGAVIGGVAGAAAGALIAENRLLGALIGGALGAGGGYLIGAKTDWFNGDDDDDDDVEEKLREAVNEAQRDPATAAEARRADTADVNDDGFVTLDEVVAMERAGFNDNEMIQRLEATNAVFDLNNDQRNYLLDAGVSRRVVNRMPQINRDERERILSRRDDQVIGR